MIFTYTCLEKEEQERYAKQTQHLVYCDLRFKSKKISSHENMIPFIRWLNSKNIVKVISHSIKRMKASNKDMPFVKQGFLLLDTAN